MNHGPYQEAEDPAHSGAVRRSRRAPSPSAVGLGLSARVEDAALRRQFDGMYAAADVCMCLYMYVYAGMCMYM